MLNEENPKKKDTKETQESPDKEQILGLLTQIASKQQDQDERLVELEKNQDGAGKAKVIVTEMAYNPDRKHLSGMTIIPLSAVEPFALANTCGAILSDEVHKGVSLADVFMESTMWLLRSVRGEGFKAATEHAKEEQIQKAEGEVAPWDIKGGG